MSSNTMQHIPTISDEDKKSLIERLRDDFPPQSWIWTNCRDIWYANNYEDEYENLDHVEFQDCFVAAMLTRPAQGQGLLEAAEADLEKYRSDVHHRAMGDVCQERHQLRLENAKLVAKIDELENKIDELEIMIECRGNMIDQSEKKIGDLIDKVCHLLSQIDELETARDSACGGGW